MRARTRSARWAHRPLAGGLLALLLPLLAPAAGHATVTTFGSPLAVPATLNTSENLAYKGTYTAVPPAPDAPNGLFHTFHYGADTALWNVAIAGGQPSAPAAGQILSVRLEGCAQAAAGGPSPLTQIHFQDISPLPGGGAKVNVSSQPFDVPVCGQNGAGGSTVTSYTPTNLCVAQGDYVDLNDEGGYVENVYRNGVAYQVMGSVAGSTMDSFLRGGGTGNGATMSSSDTTANDGFASNPNQELMLQATLATGADATPLCAGGTRGVRPPPPPAPAVALKAQTDGVNHSRIVAVAIYCEPSPGCQGVATLTAPGQLARQTRYGSTRFSLPGKRTSHVRIRLSPATLSLLRKHRAGVHTTLSVLVDGKTFTQSVLLRIF